MSRAETAFLYPRLNENGPKTKQRHYERCIGPVKLALPIDLVMSALPIDLVMSALL
jgi:hypothetical protein